MAPRVLPELLRNTCLVEPLPSWQNIWTGFKVHFGTPNLEVTNSSSGSPKRALRLRWRNVAILQFESGSDWYICVNPLKETKVFQGNCSEFSDQVHKSVRPKLTPIYDLSLPHLLSESLRLLNENGFPIAFACQKATKGHTATIVKPSQLPSIWIWIPWPLGYCNGVKSVEKKIMVVPNTSI